MGTESEGDIAAMGQRARRAARALARAPGALRAAALTRMGEELTRVRDEVRRANAADVASAEQAGMAAPLVRRLAMTDKVYDYMASRLRQVAALPDPVGRVLEGHVRPDGLQVCKVTVPIGVIGIIYESRPNVTTDAAAVCLKSGNVVILRGGSEALRTNGVLADAMMAAVCACGLPGDVVQMVRTPGHEAVSELLALDDCIDVLIPRGGKGLIRRIAAGTRIPVIKHYEGICHLYLAPDAPVEMACRLVVNSKCQRVEVCNALETLLVDAACADRCLPAVVSALAEAGVSCVGCEASRVLVPGMDPAGEDTWRTEYLAPRLSVRVVPDLDAAIDHVNTYGSGHTDGIVTQRMDWAQHFVDGVDSASVMVNASTRLSGGGAYGMGAVVGISTDKLHARGPVGPAELTSTKWVAVGSGHLRA